MSEGRDGRGWRWAKRSLQVLAGIGLGLVVAEVVFCVRDHDAFPHLNVYVADADRAVRLRPGATELVAFGKNPRTSVRISAGGYRGDEWLAPADDEIAVIGDSQVFG